MIKDRHIPQKTICISRVSGLCYIMVHFEWIFYSAYIFLNQSSGLGRKYCIFSGICDGLYLIENQVKSQQVKLDTGFLIHLLFAPGIAAPRDNNLDEVPTNADDWRFHKWHNTYTKTRRKLREFFFVAKKVTLFVYLLPFMHLFITLYLCILMERISLLLQSDADPAAAGSNPPKHLGNCVGRVLYQPQ